MWCIVFFVLGFLTDKVRIFPFVLGIILGIILKSLAERPSKFDLHSVVGTVKDLYVDLWSRQEGPSTSEKVHAE